MITTILFDKDGTLFDFQASWGGFALRFCQELAGGDLAQAARIGAAVGFDLEQRRFEPDSPIIAGTPGEIAGALLPHVPGSTAQALVARMNLLAAETPQQEATPLQPLMKSLRAGGMTLGVITNDAATPAKAHLQAAGILDDLAHVIGCDCGFGQKPGPGQINAFLEMTGAAPEETLMVGDSTHDLRAAQAAGCRGVGVLTGLATAQQLAPLAWKVIPNISQLPRLLRAMVQKQAPAQHRIDAA